MKIATASLNYYGQNTHAKAHAAGVRAKRTGSDFIGFTEVRSPAMRRGLEDGLGPLVYDLQGEGNESPVAHRKGRWEMIDFMVKKGTDGEAGITPALFLVIGVYRKVKNPLKIIEVISTHLVPLTLHGHKRPHYAHRHAMWVEHWNLLRQVVNDALALGHSVFVIGDFNNSAAGKKIIKQIHPNAKWVIRHGLDWVFAVEGNVRIKRFGLTRKFKDGSDHSGVWRNLILI